jgi:hypothetical protein
MELTAEDTKNYNSQMAQLVGYNRVKCYIRENTGDYNEKKYSLTHVYTTDESKLKFKPKAKEVDYYTLDIVNTERHVYLLEEMWRPDQCWDDMMLCFDQIERLGYKYAISPKYVSILDGQGEGFHVVAEYNEDISTRQNAYLCIIDFIKYIKTQV